MQCLLKRTFLFFLLITLAYTPLMSCSPSELVTNRSDESDLQKLDDDLIRFLAEQLITNRTLRQQLLSEYFPQDEIMDDTDSSMQQNTASSFLTKVSPTVGHRKKLPTYKQDIKTGFAKNSKSKKIRRRNRKHAAVIRLKAPEEPTTTINHINLQTPRAKEPDISTSGEQSKSNLIEDLDSLLRNFASSLKVLFLKTLNPIPTADLENHTNISETQAPPVSTLPTLASKQQTIMPNKISEGSSNRHDTSTLKHKDIVMSSPTTSLKKGPSLRHVTTYSSSPPSDLSENDAESQLLSVIQYLLKMSTTASITTKGPITSLNDNEMSDLAISDETLEQIASFIAEKAKIGQDESDDVMTTATSITILPTASMPRSKMASTSTFSDKCREFVRETIQQLTSKAQRESDVEEQDDDITTISNGDDQSQYSDLCQKELDANLNRVAFMVAQQLKQQLKPQNRELTPRQIQDYLNRMQRNIYSL